MCAALQTESMQRHCPHVLEAAQSRVCKGAKQHSVLQQVAEVTAVGAGRRAVPRCDEPSRLWVTHAACKATVLG
jgi:hypothetical protein